MRRGGGRTTRHDGRRRLWALVALLSVVVGVACADGDDDDDDDGGGDVTREDGAEVEEPELREELIEMQEADQAERTGESDQPWDDQPRTDRLAEIIDEHGWPTRDLVGADGATAAWLIAQHSDLDVDFQEEALELMRDAGEAGDVDLTELAYLEDRVALNRGRPQIYGTQIGCVDGRAEPAELADPDRVDELRDEVGLQPLADYLAEIEPECRAEAAQ